MAGSSFVTVGRSSAWGNQVRPSESRVLMGERIERQGGVRVRGTGAHLGRHPDRLHDLLRAGALARRLAGMSLDAVGALRGVGDSYGDELLGLLRQRAIGEHRTAECLECVVDLWRKFL